jgi:uncharacterized membrane protein
MSFQDEVIDAGQEARLHNRALIGWISYGVGLVTSWVTGPIGFIIALISLSESKSTRYESHFQAMVQGGLICFCGYTLGWLLIFTFIGAILGGPLLLVTWLYNLYIVVRGLMRVSERRRYD